MGFTSNETPFCHVRCTLREAPCYTKVVATYTLSQILMNPTFYFRILRVSPAVSLGRRSVRSFGKKFMLCLMTSKRSGSWKFLRNCYTQAQRIQDSNGTIWIARQGFSLSHESLCSLTLSYAVVVFLTSEEQFAARVGWNLNRRVDMVEKGI